MRNKLGRFLLSIRHFIDFFTRFPVIVRALFSGYHYSLYEYWLYLRYTESPGPVKNFPSVEVLAQDNQYAHLKIGSRCYYWPSESNQDDLPWVYQEVLVPALQNPHAYQFAGVKVNPGDYVVDAGAFVGFFVHYALQLGARVLALEPIPSLADAMCKTFASEIAERRVRVLPAALGAAPGQASLALVPERLYESKLSDEGIQTEVVTLDDILGGEKVDFIKMDVEGAEMDAVLGSTRTIAVNKPRLAIAVYHEYENAHRVCQLLHSIRPEYQIRYRGIYASNGCKPRPFMVYAW